MANRCPLGLCLTPQGYISLIPSSLEFVYTIYPSFDVLLIALRLIVKNSKFLPYTTLPYYIDTIGSS